MGIRGGEDGLLYVGFNVNCGNILFIFLEEFVKDGLLEKIDLLKFFLVKCMDFFKVVVIKNFFILKVVVKFVSKSLGKFKEELERFRKDLKIFVWLEDVVLFVFID